MKISIQHAADLLSGGAVVGVPTETVYGLAASLNRPDAIQQIFSLKKRPQDNPLIIHLSSAAQIYHFTDSLPLGFIELTEKFWPGPLTLVIPTIKNIPKEVRAGLSTAAFRMPNHPKALDLIERTGPLVMPSANLSGTPSSTHSEHVENDFGANFPVVEGSSSFFGIESTILIDVSERWEVGRLGAIPLEDLQSVLGYMPQPIEKKSLLSPLCPGQKYRHYAPKAKLSIAEHIPENCEVILGFKERDYPKHLPLLSLGSLKDAYSVSKCLYNVLREIDLLGFKFAWIDSDFPNNHLWISIRERLEKAANNF